MLVACSVPAAEAAAQSRPVLPSWVGTATRSLDPRAQREALRIQFSGSWRSPGGLPPALTAVERAMASDGVPKEPADLGL
eukprot:11756581-Alexandrium_andersonii.AAC.1